MSAALCVWALALAIFACARGRPRASARLAMTGALLLYPTAAGAAFSLLSCQGVSLSAAAFAVLDGGSSLSQVAARSRLTVSVLATNPFFVCFAGSHRPAAILAIVVIVLYIAMLPLMVFWLLRRDAWLRGELAASSSRRGGPIARRSQPATSAGDTATGTSKAVAGGETEKSRAPDPLLLPFLADSGYQPAFWWFRHADLTASLALSAIEAFVPRPLGIVREEGALPRWRPKSSPPRALSLLQLVGKLVGIVVVVLVLLVLTLTLRPHAVGHTWKRPVRSLLLILAFSCAAMNASLTALDLGLGDSSLAASITTGSFVVLVIFIATAVALVVGFGSEIYRSAKANRASGLVRGTTVLVALRARVAARRALRTAAVAAEPYVAENDADEPRALAGSVGEFKAKRSATAPGVDDAVELGGGAAFSAATQPARRESPAAAVDSVDPPGPDVPPQPVRWAGRERFFFPPVPGALSPPDGADVEAGAAPLNTAVPASPPPRSAAALISPSRALISGSTSAAFGARSGVFNGGDEVPRSPSPLSRAPSPSVRRGWVPDAPLSPQEIADAATAQFLASVGVSGRLPRVATAAPAAFRRTMLAAGGRSETALGTRPGASPPHAAGAAGVASQALLQRPPLRVWQVAEETRPAPAGPEVAPARDVRTAITTVHTVSRPDLGRADALKAASDAPHPTAPARGASFLFVRPPPSARQSARSARDLHTVLHDEGSEEADYAADSATLGLDAPPLGVPSPEQGAAAGAAFVMRASPRLRSSRRLSPIVPAAASSSRGRLPPDASPTAAASHGSSGAAHRAAPVRVFDFAEQTEGSPVRGGNAGSGRGAAGPKHGPLQSPPRTAAAAAAGPQPLPTPSRIAHVPERARVVVDIGLDAWFSEKSAPDRVTRAPPAAAAAAGRVVRRESDSGRSDSSSGGSGGQPADTLGVGGGHGALDSRSISTQGGDASLQHPQCAEPAAVAAGQHAVDMYPMVSHRGGSVARSPAPPPEQHQRWMTLPGQDAPPLAPDPLAAAAAPPTERSARSLVGVADALFRTPRRVASRGGVSASSPLTPTLSERRAATVDPPQPASTDVAVVLDPSVRVP